MNGTLLYSFTGMIPHLRLQLGPCGRMLCLYNEGQSSGWVRWEGWGAYVLQR